MLKLIAAIIIAEIIEHTVEAIFGLVRTRIKNRKAKSLKWWGTDL